MTFRLWERLRDWLLLLVLLSLSVGVMLARNVPLVRALRAASLESTAWVEARFAWAGRYLSALEENELLREENISLASEVARSREAIIENDRLRSLIAFRDSTGYRLLAARIVDRDVTRQQNFLTIDIGAADSVEVGMAVVNDRGIIGKVVEVAPSYARVMSYLHTDFRMPAKVLPLGTTGSVGWDGERRDRLLMEFVSRTEPVLRGQQVVTSGFSASFPPGFAVGYVDSVAALPGRNQLQVFVQPASPLDRAEFVFVVLDRPVPERLEERNFIEEE